MKYKFFNPLGNATEHKITQTTHGESKANPNDLSKQQAVDTSAIGGTPVYAVADGIIFKVYNAASKSYFALDFGMPFYALYVHCKTDLKEGSAVKLGQKIGEVVAMTDSHLHFGFKNKDVTPPKYNPMEYFDRATRFYATGPAIKKLWCLPGGDIDWSKFRDLYLGKEDTPVNPCAELQSKYNLLLTQYEKNLLALEIALENEGVVKRENQRLTADLATSALKVVELTGQLNERDLALKKYKSDYDKIKEEYGRATEIAKQFETVSGALSGLINAIIARIKNQNKL